MCFTVFWKEQLISLFSHQCATRLIVHIKKLYGSASLGALSLHLSALNINAKRFEGEFDLNDLPDALVELHVSHNLLVGTVGTFIL